MSYKEYPSMTGGLQERTQRGRGLLSEDGGQQGGVEPLAEFKNLYSRSLSSWPTGVGSSKSVKWVQQFSRSISSPIHSDFHILNCLYAAQYVATLCRPIHVYQVIKNLLSSGNIAWTPLRLLHTSSLSKASSVRFMGPCQRHLQSDLPASLVWFSIESSWTYY